LLRVGHDHEVERTEDGSHLLSRRQVTTLAQLRHRPVDLPPGDGPTAGRDQLHGSSAFGQRSQSVPESYGGYLGVSTRETGRCAGSLDGVSTGSAFAGPSILPAPLRRPAGGVAVVAVTVFAVLAERYGGEASARWLDRRLQSLVGASGPAHSISEPVILFGNRISVVVLAVLLSGLALALGHRRLAVLAIVGPGLTGLATELLKPLIGRTFNGDFAFPSGHAGGATALGIVAALLLIGVLGPELRTSAALLAAGAVLSGGMMAFALVASRDHYPTDAIGGFCIAVGVVLASALLIEWWAEHN
jgi:membrane-associated phospholipid phosphatase